MNTIVRNSYTPKVRDYCNKIVIDEEKGVQYIFDSDGVFSTYTSKQQEGATLYYVDSAIKAAKSDLRVYANTRDAEVLAEAKAYTDEHSDPSAVSKAYVDEQDAAILSEAKSYADTKASAAESAAKAYTDSALSGASSSVLADAQAYTDNKALEALSAANTYTNSTVANLDIPVVTLSNVDIGEGQPLAANHFYGVYE